MNLIMLEYFIVAAEEQSISGAAQKLFVSQPAVTRQIQNLEKELNVMLFTRSKPKLILTEEGKTLFYQAKLIMDSVNNIVSNTSTMKIRTRLTIGYTANLEFDMLFKAVSKMAEKHPECKMEFYQGNMGKLQEDLMRGRYDIIVSPLTGLRNDNVEILPIVDSTQVLAVSVHNPLSKKKQVSLSELKNEKFITFVRAESQPHSDMLVMDCNEVGFSPKIIAEADNTNTYLLMIAANQGIALVGSDLENLSHGGIAFIPVEEYADRHILSGAAWMKENKNPARIQFVNELKRLTLHSN